VKRSGRDEPMWIAIHMCMEATLGISLYSYLYLKLAKMLCLSYYLLVTKLENKRAEQVQPGRGGGRGGPNNVYTCEQMQKGLKKKFCERQDLFCLSCSLLNAIE
jgi:hypothetical protein